MQDVLLVLETSCVQSSAAAWCGERLLCQTAWRAERNHSSAIFKAVRQVLDALEGRRLKEIVVGSGPGSYGGIRVALAVADGLSLVHGSRVAAFSSWNGLDLLHGKACVMSDARRGGWTWGKLENGVLTDVPAVLPAEQARACVAECLEKGVPVFSTETAEHLAAREMSGIVPVCPSAGALGAAWMAQTEARREELLESPAEPLYIRAPHITRAKRPAWAVKA
ncbi:MAG: tRNA (adenosine(37)-N6)-threonylcarbamoyltransferase complex dimerization subunit type 1 TsaB [Akkermansia muciniphila]|uniref:tRNA (adenosine(37)-N6)-threonylcarbamoyltransferase complex dimerization subunit type 1 TsaB n=2 Tax=uncultured Akkermansia sp. TaxID=512294 RepID=UPI00260553F1|nr:tRNA (adenosine(37)-N6)-threonylcarbamoyltransferase complex dimerization subunit type 1 TsaB [uncultured Akkermansia sp.]